MEDLDRRIREALVLASDPAIAGGQQAYMKTVEPFLGVRVPHVRRLVDTIVRDADMLDREAWEVLVHSLFDAATHREHRYAAIGVMRHRNFRRYRDARCIPLVRHVVAEGAWWDLVDEASLVLGDALASDATMVSPIVAAWAEDDDIWVRRSAVICQRAFGTRVDLELLTVCLDAQRGRTEFWLRKACGWALREVSYQDPDWVRHYADSRPISPLTRREALRVIQRRDGTGELDGVETPTSRRTRRPANR